jgi:glycosyltransferase involved in cell wall biosynthesis
MKYSRVRVYHDVRTAHLERFHALPPASVLFQRQRYDFDAALAQGLDLTRVSLPRLAVVLLRSRVTSVEVNEPLMRSGLPVAATAVAAVRTARLLGRPRTQVVTYAIENRDTPDPSPTGVKRRLHSFRERQLIRFVTKRLDRVAFGTDAAADLYGRRLGRYLRHVSTVTIPALPAPCRCPPAERDPDQVLFVGAFEPRKGIEQLLAAWPAVRDQRPQSRLRMIGKGSLQERVEHAVARDPSMRLTVDPPRAEIHRAYRSAHVVVLLSQPAPNWREQVGLPIVEALAHGCIVVTTSQTGLARWLSEHGHRVGADSGPDAVPAWIRAALDDKRSAADVAGDLPEVDGRLAADRWLFASS